MVAQRVRMDVIAQNVAGATLTRTADGTPYRRQITVFSEYTPLSNIDPGSPVEFGSILSQTMAERRAKKLAGVQAVQIVEDQTPFTPVYDPTHPDADESGYYYLPNVDVQEEQIDALAATRSWDANYAIFEGLVSMSQKALLIGKG
jgi:flagellar basal-body rod protein FlgC